MRDIAALRRRVDDAERQLKANETARTRESEALIDTWDSIRERFAAQEAEIARYRAEVESLTDSNASLGRMVDDLIAIIDGNIDRGHNETVPKIAALASDLLVSEPSAEDLARLGSDVLGQAPTTEQPDEPHLDTEPAPDPQSGEAAWHHDTDTSASVEGSAFAPAAESLSPGIRSLIQRVQGTVGDSRDAEAAFDEDGAIDLDAVMEVDTEGDGGDDALARELQEIETLRNELSGLRDRIAAADG